MLINTYLAIPGTEDFEAKDGPAPAEGGEVFRVYGDGQFGKAHGWSVVRQPGSRKLANSMGAERNG